MKKILAFRPDENGVYTYRMTTPLTPLGAKFRKDILTGKEGPRLTLGKLAEQLKKQGDIWVFKYVTDPETVAWIVKMKEHVGATLVVDLDDWVFEIPWANPAARHYDPMKLQALQWFLQQADYITCSTHKLAEKLSFLGKEITVLPNLVNPKLWMHKSKKKKDGVVRIGWAFTSTHVTETPIFERVMTRIKEKYGDKVEILVMNAPEGSFKFDFTPVEGTKHVDYPKVYSELGLDIAVCPLAKNEFNKCKSNIKWMESTLAGAAVVASRIYPYEFSIVDGKTGFLAGSENQWVNQISKLVENEQLRKEMVQNATEEIMNNYTIDTNDQWETFYASI